MRILLLDNYDSFTYNLYDYARVADPNAKIEIHRNDQITLDTAVNEFDCYIISPGPGLPEESGILKQLLKAVTPQKPCLAVCLGMQALAEVYGGKLYNLGQPYHGLKRSIQIIDHEDPLFSEVKTPFEAGRYHSWAVIEEGLDSRISISAVDLDGIIMSMYFKGFPVHGVQFHPESILTPDGLQMIRNFIRTAREWIN